MSDYDGATNADAENISEKNILTDVSKDKQQLFRRAIFEGLSAKIDKTTEEYKDIELPPPSKRHKIRMNRLFRERVGGSFLPFPEVDCFYERIRSKIVVKLKINEFIDRCKKT